MRDADEVPGWRRGLYRRISLLLVACLAVAGLVSYQRADQVATELAQQRAVAAAAKPVRGPFTTAEVEKLARKVTPILVDVEIENRSLGVGGAGTGIVLSPNGEILTNNHVINGADVVEVVTKGNGRRYPATVLGYDRNNDVALLRVANPRAFTGAAIGDSTQVRVGEPVMGIGNAGGKGGKPVRAPGKVTGLNKSISTSDELTGSTENLKGLIEVAADIRPGDSGGPLVNEAGQVIGVNTAASISFKTDVPNGTGYAIPIHQAMSIVQVIRAGRSTDQVHVGPTGVLGVAVSGPPLRSDGSIQPGLQPGARVRVVGYGSPAADVGIVEGDTIVGMDGVKIDSPTRLTAAVGRHGPNDRLPIEWQTATGERRTGTVTLVEGPPM